MPTEHTTTSPSGLDVNTLLPELDRQANESGQYFLPEGLLPGICQQFKGCPPGPGSGGKNIRWNLANST
jgi:hypothetical protein